MKTKQLFTTLTILCLSICLFAVPASAAEIVDSGECGENVTWTLDSEGTLTISGTGDMIYDVSPWWFNDCITNVVIENGVTSIGTNAFNNCSNLNDIIIPDSVVRIRSYAFSNCTSLTNVLIPQSVTFFGEWIFSDCSSLTEISIPDGINAIHHGMFENCISLEEITIPASVEYIGFNAFSNCTSLTSIAIPAAVNEIDTGALNNCTNLSSILVDEGNEYYCNDDNGVLYNKEKTTLIQVPGTISGTYSVPDTITRIENGAFSNSGVNKIIFSDNAPNIAELFLGGPMEHECIFPGAFSNITATAYYPATNNTWTEEVLQDYGGNITWVPYEPEEPEVAPGNVDGNDSVDYFDAMIVIQYFTGMIGEDDLNVSAADVDGSGSVDFFDAMYILQYFAGLIDKFPVE